MFIVSLTELLLSTINHLIVLNKFNTSGAVRILCHLHSSKCKIKHTATSKLMRSCDDDEEKRIEGDSITQRVFCSGSDARPDRSLWNLQLC